MWWHEAHRGFRWLCICSVGEKQTSSLCTSNYAISRRHTIAVNDGGKIKICERHETFEMIR